MYVNAYKILAGVRDGNILDHAHLPGNYYEEAVVVGSEELPVGPRWKQKWIVKRWGRKLEKLKYQLLFSPGTLLLVEETPAENFIVGERDTDESWKRGWLLRFH
jgi:hypothetical protein